MREPPVISSSHCRSAVSKEELIKHVVQALSGCTEAGQELNAENTTIAFVGKDTPFTILEGKETLPYVSAIDCPSLVHVHDGPFSWLMWSLQTHPRTLKKPRMKLLLQLRKGMRKWHRLEQYIAVFTCQVLKLSPC